MIKVSLPRIEISMQSFIKKQGHIRFDISLVLKNNKFAQLYKKSFRNNSNWTVIIFFETLVETISRLDKILKKKIYYWYYKIINE